MSVERWSAPTRTKPTPSALNWGDGSSPTTIVLPSGQDSFSASHTYVNNPAGVGSEDYTITGTVTNQYNQVGYASANVTVNKVAPQFTAADLSLSPRSPTRATRSP